MPDEDLPRPPNPAYGQGPRPRRARTSKLVDAEEWNELQQWLRGTLEYPNGGGFAGDVGRRLAKLEAHYDTVKLSLDGMPARVAAATADQIERAARERDEKVRLAALEAERQKRTQTVLARRNRILSIVVGALTIVVAAIILALLSNFLTIHGAGDGLNLPTPTASAPTSTSSPTARLLTPAPTARL